MIIETRPIAIVSPICASPARSAIDEVGIVEFSSRQEIVVDKRGVIINGNLWRLAAKELGFAEDPVHVRELTPTKRICYDERAYVDGAILRWQQFNGKAALDGDRRGFSEVGEIGGNENLVEKA
jgi:hypothetical protein